jgi:hypothetical protein
VAHGPRTIGVVAGALMNGVALTVGRRRGDFKRTVVRARVRDRVSLLSRTDRLTPLCETRSLGVPALWLRRDGAGSPTYLFAPMAAARGRVNAKSSRRPISKVSPAKSGNFRSRESGVSDGSTRATVRSTVHEQHSMRTWVTGCAPGCRVVPGVEDCPLLTSRCSRRS